MEKCQSCKSAGLGPLENQKLRIGGRLALCETKIENRREFRPSVESKLKIGGSFALYKPKLKIGGRVDLRKPKIENRRAFRPVTPKLKIGLSLALRGAYYKSQGT